MTDALWKFTVRVPSQRGFGRSSGQRDLVARDNWEYSTARGMNGTRLEAVTRVHHGVLVKVNRVTVWDVRVTGTEDGRSVRLGWECSHQHASSGEEEASKSVEPTPTNCRLPLFDTRERVTAETGRRSPHGRSSGGRVHGN